jgi:hypothetical protein
MGLLEIFRILLRNCRCFVTSTLTVFGLCFPPCVQNLWIISKSHRYCLSLEGKEKANYSLEKWAADDYSWLCLIDRENQMTEGQQLWLLLEYKEKRNINQQSFLTSSPYCFNFQPPPFLQTAAFSWKQSSTPDLSMTSASEVRCFPRQQNTASCLFPPCLTNSWSLHVDYPGITLLVQTQTVLPQLMFWSTMCRLKALSYMTGQIKPDHRIWSTLVGYDSRICSSQQSHCFPHNPRKTSLSYYTSLSFYTDAFGLSK